MYFMKMERLKQTLATALAFVMMLGIVVINPTITYANDATTRITWDVDGGTFIDPTQATTQFAVPGQRLTIPPTQPPEGHTLRGWFNGSVQWHETTPVPNYDIIIRAVWDAIPTVTWDVNRGSFTNPNTEEIQRVMTGERLTMPSVQPPEGYTFSGWFNGNVQWNANSPMPNHSITLTARWNAIPIVSPSPSPSPDPILSTQDITFVLHFVNATGQATTTEHTVTVTNRGGNVNALTAINNLRPSRIPINSNGATGNANFVSWSSSPITDFAATTTVRYLPDEGNRTIHLYARYQVRVQIFSRSVNDIENSRNVDLQINHLGVVLPQPGQSNGRLYAAPLEATIMRRINVPFHNTIIQVTAPHRFDSWQTQRHTTPVGAINLTSQVRAGSINNFVFPANGTLPIFGWYVLDEGETFDITFVYNNHQTPAERVLTVPANSTIHGYRPANVSGASFTGWYEVLEDGTFIPWINNLGNSIANRPITRDIRLYARYRYTITFNTNGALPASIAPQNVYVGFQTSVPAIGEINFTELLSRIPEPRHPNPDFEFLGWFTYRSDTVNIVVTFPELPDYFEGRHSRRIIGGNTIIDALRPIREDEEIVMSEMLIAVFTPPRNGGGGSDSNPVITTVTYVFNNDLSNLVQHVVLGQPFPNRATTNPTRATHTFDDFDPYPSGWTIRNNDIAPPERERVDFGVTRATEHMIIDANWRINYNFEFMVHGRIIQDSFINYVERNNTLGQDSPSSRISFPPNEHDTALVPANCYRSGSPQPIARFDGWDIIYPNSNILPPTAIRFWDGLERVPVNQANFGPAQAVNSRIRFIARWHYNPLVTFIDGALVNETFPTMLNNRGDFVITFPTDPARRGQVFMGWNTCIGYDAFGNALPPNPNGFYTSQSTFADGSHTTLYSRWRNADNQVNFVVDTQHVRSLNNLTFANTGETPLPPTIRCDETGEIVIVSTWHLCPNFTDSPVNFPNFIVDSHVTFYGNPRSVGGEPLPGHDPGDDRTPIIDVGQIDGPYHIITLHDAFGRAIGRARIAPNSIVSRTAFNTLPGIPPGDSRFYFNNSWLAGFNPVTEQTATANPGTHYGIQGTEWNFAETANPDRINFDLNLYAGAIHRVTFNYNHPDYATRSLFITRGDSIELPDVTLDGYFFLGWFASNGELWNPDYRIFEHTTLTAEWTDVPPAPEVIYNLSVTIGNFTYVADICNNEDGESTITIVVPRSKIESGVVNSATISHLVVSGDYHMIDGCEFTSAQIGDTITFDYGNLINVGGRFAIHNRVYTLVIVPMEVSTNLWIYNDDTGYVYRQYPNGFIARRRPPSSPPNINNNSAWWQLNRHCDGGPGRCAPEANCWACRFNPYLYQVTRGVCRWFDFDNNSWHYLHNSGVRYHNCTAKPKPSPTPEPILQQLYPPFVTPDIEIHTIFVDDLMTIYQIQHAYIRFTMDGTDPTEQSFLYMQPLRFNEVGRVEIRAIAFPRADMEDWLPSEIAIFVFEVLCRELSENEYDEDEVNEPPSEELIYELSITIDGFVYVADIYNSEYGNSTITITIPCSKIENGVVNAVTISHLVVSGEDFVLDGYGFTGAQIGDGISFSNDSIITVGEQFANYNRVYTLYLVPMETATNLWIYNDATGYVYRQYQNGFAQRRRPPITPPSIGNNSAWNNLSRHCVSGIDCLACRFNPYLYQVVQNVCRWFDFDNNSWHFLHDSGVRYHLPNNNNNDNNNIVDNTNNDNSEDDDQEDNDDDYDSVEDEDNDDDYNSIEDEDSDDDYSTVEDEDNDDDYSSVEDEDNDDDYGSVEDEDNDDDYSSVEDENNDDDYSSGEDEDNDNDYNSVEDEDNDDDYNFVEDEDNDADYNSDENENNDTDDNTTDAGYDNESNGTVESDSNNETDVNSATNEQNGSTETVEDEYTQSDFAEDTDSVSENLVESL